MKKPWLIFLLTITVILAFGAVDWAELGIGSWQDLYLNMRHNFLAMLKNVQ